MSSRLLFAGRTYIDSTSHLPSYSAANNQPWSIFQSDLFRGIWGLLVRRGEWAPEPQTGANIQE